MDVTYSELTKNIFYGTTSESVSPIIINTGGLFILSQNINNINIDASNGIVTFSNPINVSTYNFDIIYILNSNQTINSYTLNVLELNIICFGNNKIYDKSIIATLTLSGIVNNDVVIPPNAYFDDYYVGINKNITISGFLSGINSNNYNLTTTITNANILPKNVTINFKSIKKQYDGNTNVKIYFNDISGIYYDDELYLKTFVANFENPTINTNKIINITNITLSGLQSNNYYVNETSQILGTIIPMSDHIFLDKLLYTDISNITFDNLVYDYSLFINLMLIPDKNLSFSTLFNTAKFSSQGLENYEYNIILSNSNEIINQQNIILIEKRESNLGFYSFTQTPLKLGDRLLEIVAHKIFGHAKAQSAISNDTDFYNYDQYIWNYFVNSFSNHEVLNDMHLQYLILKKPEVFNFNPYKAYCDIVENENYNFNNIQFTFPMFLNGHVNNVIASFARNVGGTQITNGNYNIPILIKIL